MKQYDYLKAKKIINQNKDEITSAELGMAGDWFGTAETIYQDGKYTIDLDMPKLKIAGIDGSHWATPMLKLEYKDGEYQKFDCYK